LEIAKHTERKCCAAFGIKQMEKRKPLDMNLTEFSMTKAMLAMSFARSVGEFLLTQELGISPAKERRQGTDPESSLQCNFGKSTPRSLEKASFLTFLGSATHNRKESVLLCWKARGERHFCSERSRSEETRRLQSLSTRDFDLKVSETRHWLMRRALVMPLCAWPFSALGNRKVAQTLSAESAGE